MSDFRFTEKQKEFFSDWKHNRLRRLNILEGSVRSGKTFSSLIMWALWLATRPENGKYLMVGRTLTTLKRNCLEPLLAILGEEMDKNIAEAVYVGMSTDTGCFRFANTTAHSFTVAAVCAKAGADIYGLNQQLFEPNSLPKLRMHAWMIENMKLLDDGKLAIVAIPRAVEELLRVTDDDMDNISSYPRTVAGVRMAATLRQTKDGETKISVRAVPGYDAAAVCAEFGGGGHVGAAGASTHLGLEEAAKRLEEAMLAQ